MPTTLTGLVLFVISLLPGFAYLVGKERNGTERHASPFRETVAVIAASVVSEIAVLSIFSIMRCLWPTETPDVGALVRHGSVYLREHYASVAAWGAGMLAVAVVVAYVATLPMVRKLITWPVGAYPHDSTVSSWWLLFEKWKTVRRTVPGRKVGKTRKVTVTRDVQVECVLDDDSSVRGMLASFNNSADESPDRDLVLKAPVEYRSSGARELKPTEASAVSIPASRIVSLFVGYFEPTPVPVRPVPAQPMLAVPGHAVPTLPGQAAVPAAHTAQSVSGPTAAAQT
jgi:Family of unknown function (DUF6338)